nr:hypothetical protein Iba_scaffold952CG0070 [Ipomoea batatas]
MIFATQHLYEIPRRFPFIPHRRRVPACFRRAPVINVKHWANSPADLPPPAKHYRASTSSDQAPTNTNSESDEASCNPEIGCSSGAAICHSLTRFEESTTEIRISGHGSSAISGRLLHFSEIDPSKP